MALTATADKITREDIFRQLHLNGKTFVSSFDRPNLSLAVRREGTKAEKIKFILRHIGSHPGDAGIIYCLSRKNTEVVAEELKRRASMLLPIMPGFLQKNELLSSNGSRWIRYR